MAAKKHIIIVYTNTGGGHKATARALKKCIENEHGHRVSLVNLYEEIIGDLDFIRRYTPYTGEQVYNHYVLGKGWTGLFCLAFYGEAMLNIRLIWKKAINTAIAYWQTHKPDLVISVMPLVNKPLHISLQTVSVPLMIILTDYREVLKGTWFPPAKDYQAVCGTAQAYQDLLKKPHSGSNVQQTSGLLVHPKFYADPPTDIPAERSKQSLKPDLITACMLYGSEGSLRMLQLAQELSKSSIPLQIIFLCGYNAQLAEKLTALQLPYPHLICNFTREIPYYMHLADFFIGKPGGSSMSEALAMKLPLLLDRKNLLAQERHNLSWAKQHQIALPFKTLRSFQQAVQQFATPATFGLFQQQVEKLPPNRAIFEVMPTIENLLEERLIQER